MTAESIEITIPLLDITLHVRCGLGSIKDGNGTNCMRFFNDLFNGALHTKDIADRSKSHDFCLFVDLCQVFIRKMAFFIKVHINKLGPCTACHTLPRHNIGMVLRNGDDDFVPCMEIRFPIASGH